MMDWVSISVVEDGCPSRNLPNNKLLKAGLRIANRAPMAWISLVFPGLPTLNMVSDKEFSFCNSLHSLAIF